MVSVYPLVLLGGGQVHMQLQKGEFVISLDDGWIRFVAASHQVRGGDHAGRAAEFSCGQSSVCLTRGGAFQELCAHLCVVLCVPGG